MFYVFSFPAGVYVGPLNSIASIHSPSILTLSKIRSDLSTDHRILFCNAYITPHFEYCSVVWCNTSNNNINKIHKLQRQYDGLENSLKRLNILSFDQFFFLNKAKIMYKDLNNLAPISYLQELFQIRDVTFNNTASNLRSISQNN